jgi:predicted DNA-binding protein (MmcQ/YjbR family)
LDWQFCDSIQKEPMNIDAIRKYCLGFPGATEKLQWNDALCFKIRGKLFTVAGLDKPRLSLKVTPEKFAELIEHENVHPSLFLGRCKWVMLDRLDALPDHEIKDLIRQSYEMVEASAPGNSRPAKHKLRKRK